MLLNHVKNNVACPFGSFVPACTLGQGQCTGAHGSDITFYVRQFSLMTYGARRQVLLVPEPESDRSRIIVDGLNFGPERKR